MKNKRNTWRHLIKVVLILLLCFSMTSSIPGYALADKKSDLEEQIRKQQQEIEKAEKEKKSLKDDLTDVEKVKKSLVKSKNSLAEYVKDLDEQVAVVQGRIDTLTGQITEKEAQITETKAELEDAQETADTHYDAMKVRIQTLYEQGELYYVEVLAASGSFGDFLNKLDYINQLSAYDNNKMNEYKEIVRYVTVCKEKLEAEEEVLVATKEAAQQEEAALEELIAEKEKEITAYEKDIANKEKLIREYEAEIAEQTAIIEELEKAVEQAKRDLRNQRVYDGGKFCWPAPDYTRISDNYGYRIHPITGKKQFHTGVDMASPGGSRILAAYDGDIIQAAYNATMGNYIMIDHGDGIYTIYMHAQKLLVKQGDVVSRGQKIATVGSTGRSTGNHLHFSVRVNGSYVSPWDYIVEP